MEKKNSVTREEVIRKTVGFYEYNKKHNRSLDYFNRELRFICSLFGDDIESDIFAEFDKRGL